MKRFRSSSNLAALTVWCLNCHLNTVPFHLKGPRVYLSEVWVPQTYSVSLTPILQASGTGLASWPEHSCVGSWVPVIGKIRSPAAATSIRVRRALSSTD